MDKIKVPARIIYQMDLQIKEQEQRVSKAKEKLEELIKARKQMEAI